MWMTQAELLNAVNHQKSDASNVTAGSSSCNSSSTAMGRKRSKNLNYGAASGEMKEGIWRQLPTELVLKVIAKLPILELFRDRSINRAANNMVFEFLCREKEYALSIRGPEADESSGGFLRMHYHETSSSNNLVILQPLVLDCNKEVWHKLPFFPFQGIAQHEGLISAALINAGLVVPSGVQEPSSYLELIAGNAGLICVARRWAFDKRIAMAELFCVYNPLNRSWRDLPCPPTHFHDVFAQNNKTILTVDKAAGSFNLVFVSKTNANNNDLNVGVYSSTSDSWRLSSQPNQPHYQILNIAGSSRFLIVLFQESLPNERKFEVGIVRFDLETDRWATPVWVDAFSRAFRPFQHHNMSQYVNLLEAAGTLLVCSRVLYAVVPWSRSDVPNTHTWTYAVLRGNGDADTATEFRKLTQVQIKGFHYNLRASCAWRAWPDRAGRHFISMVRVDRRKRITPTITYDVALETWSNRPSIDMVYKGPANQVIVPYEANWMQLGR